jgi:DDE family transposase
VSHVTPGPVTRQVADTCRELVARPGLPFADCLPAEQVHEAFRQLGGSFRECVYTPAVTLLTFLGQCLDPDPSCQQAVDRLLAYRAARGLPDCSGDTGAYCKARLRLPEGLLRELTRRAGRGLMDSAEDRWLWKGRRVKVVDGTGLSMPDTPANQAAYPQPRAIPAGLGFPLLRLVVVFCLSSGAALDAAMGPYQGRGTGEVSLFRGLGDVLAPGDVLLGDRIYCNYWDVARAQARGVDVVMRLHPGRKKVWFRGRGHSTANRRTWWTRPQRPARMAEEEYETYPREIPLRAVRVDVRQRGFRTRRYVLVTTLRDPAAYPAGDLAALYRRRWQAELNLRSLKTTLQMDILRGQSPGVARKEVWGHLLAYNLVRGLMAQAARATGARPDEVSFTGAVQATNAFLPKLQGARTAEEASRLWRRLVELIGRRRVGGRPDRVEPRRVKRGRKGYARLRVPRAEARRRLMQDATRKGPKT